MPRQRLWYWIATVQVALVMTGGGIVDVLRTRSSLEVLHRLGYPDYFATLLGVAHVLGALALVAPVPRTLREWAYAGFTFDVVAAVVSILAAGNPVSATAIPLYTLAMVLVSYATWRTRERGAPPSPLATPAPA